MIVTDIRYGENDIVAGYISSRLMAAYDFPNDHTVHVEPMPSDNTGRIVWHYVLERDGKTIFEGDDLSTGAFVDSDPAEVARTLLGFLTLQPGDVESDYFDHYTTAQVEWRDEYAEELSLYAIDE